MATSTSKALEKAQRREARRAATAEIMSARVRTGIGFGAAYAGEQILLALFPTLEEFGGGAGLDMAIAIGGAYFAFTDEGEFGDYALGASLVGTTQFLDRVVTAVVDFINKNKPAEGGG